MNSTEQPPSPSSPHTPRPTQSASKTAAQESVPRWQELLRFFLPLAGNPLLFFGVHSMLDAGIARFPRPEAALAAFAVAKNATLLFNAPAFVLRQAAVSLIDDPDSYHRFRRFAGIMVAVLLTILVALAYIEPLGRWLLTTVLGLSAGPVLDEAMLAWKVLCFIPIVELLRNIPQAVAISLKRTGLVPAATLKRSVFSAVLLLLGVRLGALPGALTAALVLVIGMFSETLLMVLGLRRHYPTVAEATASIPKRHHEPLTAKSFWRFHTPVATMALLMVIIPNIINAGLARSAEPEIALAAFAIVFGLSRVLSAPMLMIHQCPIVMMDGGGERTARRIFTFCMLMGLFFTGLMTLLALTPLLDWALRVLMAAPATILPVAAGAFWVLLPLPLILAWKDYHSGILMLERRTSAIGVATGVNLVFIAGLIITLLPGNEMPVRTAAVIFLVGQLIEGTVVWWHARRHASPTPTRHQQPA